MAAEEVPPVEVDEEAPVEPAEIPLEERFPDGATCQNCTYDEDAIAYCHDCERLLCEDCLTFHRRQVDTRDHHTVDSPRAEELKQLYKCPDHRDKMLDYFCTTCNKPVCQHCQVTGCKGHDLLVSTDIKNEMEALLEQVKTNKERFSHHSEYIRAQMVQNTDALNRCEAEINTTFEALIDALQSNRGDLLAKLHQETKKNDNKVKQQKEYVTRVIEEMEGTIKQTENLLSTKKDAKLMVKKVDLCANLDGRAAQMWSKELATLRSWQLNHKDMQEHASRFSQLLPKPNRESITVRNHEEARVGVKNVFTITADTADQFETYSPSEVDGFASVRIILTPINQGYNTIIRREISRKENVWTVTYFLRQHGRVNIEVSICGVKVWDVPFTLDTNPDRKEIKVGDVVVRGPDWKWENQDGGKGNKGVVTDIKRKGWVIVKWDRTKHDYRFGAQNAFDLEVVVNTS